MHNPLRVFIPSIFLLNGMPTLEEKAGVKTVHLRWLFLGPVMAIVFAMIGVMIAATYHHENEDISREVQMLHQSADAVYEDNLEHLTWMLGGITGTIVQDKEIRRALAKMDRTRLLRLTAPIFAHLQKEYEISHFYLIGTDRSVLLRAHSPAHYGDVIDRATILDAQRTKVPAHGVELGPEGALTLRFVSPLYEDEAKQRPIGFVELGVDISHLLKDLQESLGVQMFQFLSKEFLKRDVWEQKMAGFGKLADWGRFTDVVPSEQAAKNVTPAMSTMMSERSLPKAGEIMEISQDGAAFRAISYPILDMGKHAVGRMVMLIDVSSKVLAVRQTLYLGLILGVVGGGFLFGFFWFLTGKIGRLIERHQSALHHLATRDGLTGLFNHITFYNMLEDEVARLHRYGTSVSLLMLDLDHFKGINDKYGHVAGDTILKEFGKIIHRLSRSTDKVCRYGGEEITVILPEIDADGATVIAERLRSAVESHSFKLEGGQDISITVSIGVATVPEHADSARELVGVADQALYTAKERGRNRVCRYTPMGRLSKA